MSSFMAEPQTRHSPPPTALKLLDRLRRANRLRHNSTRTEAVDHSSRFPFAQ